MVQGLIHQDDATIVMGVHLPQETRNSSVRHAHSQGLCENARGSSTDNAPNLNSPNVPEQVSCVTSTPWDTIQQQKKQNPHTMNPGTGIVLRPASQTQMSAYCLILFI